jgi:chemosensory pili system protein ChpC
MRASAGSSVHSLEIPHHTLPLLVPSACMAEVVAPTRLARVPHGPNWLLGVLGWRLRPVPVISYDTLATGEYYPPGPRSRVVVLYPLPGREAWEFVGLLTSSEPQSRLVDAGATTVTVQDTYPCVAAAVRVEDRVAGIPDFDALVSLLYPAR